MGGLNIGGSNIFFVNAVEDPWKYAGMQKLNTEQDKTMFNAMIDCNNCGHCIDLKEPNDETDAQ